MMQFLVPLAQAGPGPSSASPHTFMLIAIIGFIWYFVLIKPEMKHKKERRSMQANLKKNDHVLTTGGLYGIVVQVKNDEVTIKVDEDNNVKLRFTRSAIAQVVNRTAETEAKSS